MNFGTSSISCGVNQLYELTGDQPRKFFAALKSRVDNMLSGCKDNNRYITDPARKKPETVSALLADPIYMERLLPAHFVFSDADGLKNGARFQKFIEDNNLGKTVNCESKLNINSTNMITTWIWVPDKKAVGKWYLAHSFPDGSYMMDASALGAEVARLKKQLADFEYERTKKTYGGCPCSSCKDAWEGVVKKAELELKNTIARLEATKALETTPPAPLQAATP